jgi:ABC-type sugar transport system ATPase subunit
MPILSSIQRRSPGGRVLVAVMYAFLIVGAIWMVYPFLLMVSGSVKSDVDVRQFDIFPRYVYDDAMLFRKFEEQRYSGSIDAFNGMIYVTHDQIEAMTMGDRIVVMKDGLIMQVDDPIALYDNPKNMFVAGFIGSPPMNFLHGSIQARANALWFIEKSGEGKSGGIALRVDDSQAAKLQPYIGKAVVFGIRPENINDKRLAGPSDPDCIAPAVIDVIEPMGAEVFLHLTTASHTFMARVDSHENAKVGQTLEMVFTLRKSHFFDPQTEAVIV